MQCFAIEKATPQVRPFLHFIDMSEYDRHRTVSNEQVYWLVDQKFPAAFSFRPCPHNGITAENLPTYSGGSAPASDRIPYYPAW